MSTGAYVWKEVLKQGYRKATEKMRTSWHVQKFQDRLPGMEHELISHYNANLFSPQAALPSGPPHQ